MMMKYKMEVTFMYVLSFMLLSFCEAQYANDFSWNSMVREEDALRATVQSCDNTIVKLLNAENDLKLFAKAIAETGLTATLEGPGPNTIFVPTDSAFMDLGKDPSSNILNMDLGQVIKHHIVGEYVNLQTDQAVSAPGNLVSKTLTTIDKQPMEIQITPFATNVNNDATVISNIQACNGQIVKVNRVLMPKSASLPIDPALPPQEMPVQQISTCTINECCDIQPPDYTCEDQVQWNKCEEDWLVTGGYCRKSCGFCYSAPEGSNQPPANELLQGDDLGNSPNFLSDAFDPMSAYVRKGILFQQWSKIKGSSVKDMLESQKILEKPDTTEVLTEGDDFTSPSLYASRKNSASRVSGFFCAPISGDYKFFLSSDDGGVLYLADGPADQKRRLTRVRGYKRPNEWEESDVMNLKKGKTYFLEALHKQGDGNGHLSVAVQLPSGAYLAPIPSTFFTSDCGRDLPSIQELPTPPLEVACRCTDDGYSGPTEKRVNTGKKGCFKYDFRTQLVTGAERAGQQFGSGWGQYFVQRWGASTDTVSNLANMWGSLAASTADRNENTVANICYVKYPEFCPTAFPSRDIEGASWRRC